MEHRNIKKILQNEFSPIVWRLFINGEGRKLFPPTSCAKKNLSTRSSDLQKHMPHHIQSKLVCTIQHHQTILGRTLIDNVLPSIAPVYSVVALKLK